MKGVVKMAIQVNPSLLYINDTTMKLTFSEAVTADTAEDVSNYTLGGTFGLTGHPLSASLDLDTLTTVELEIPSIARIGGLQTVTVAVTGVLNPSGDVIDVENSLATFTESNAPKIQWFEANNTDVITKWEIGQIDAGTTSPDKTILIWNNRNGIGDRSQMQDCRLTIKDKDAGDTGLLVTDKWVEARCDSMNETLFTKIGGTAELNIKAAGQPDFEISGKANDGTLSDTANYAKVTLHCTPPTGASAGVQQFKIRVSYFYT